MLRSPWVFVKPAVFFQKKKKIGSDDRYFMISQIFTVSQALEGAQRREGVFSHKLTF